MAKKERGTKTFDQIDYWVQFQRGIAWVIDMILILYPLDLIPKDISVFKVPFFYSTFAIMLLVSYFTFFEFKWGQTVGKWILGIRVYMDNGKPCTFKASLMRNLLKMVDMSIGSWLTLIMLYSTSKKQRLGDLIAHTVVVRMY